MPGDTTSAVLAEQAQRDAAVEMRPPTVADGAALWRIVVDSQVLDVNSSYAYLLWCRDFARTSVVAVADGRPVGFVTGYLRAERPDTLMVWQVAVDGDHRGRGLGRRMLDHLADRLVGESVRWLEATVTPDNHASARLFSSFAQARGAGMRREPAFPAELFPEEHEPEVLLRIGALA